MAGAPKQLDTVAGLTATTTRAIDGSGGAHGAASFYLDLTDITPQDGDLDVTLQWRTAAGNAFAIAEVTGLTSAGVVLLPLTAGVFDATRNAVIEPVEVVWTFNDGGGDAPIDVDGTVYAMYGE